MLVCCLNGVSVELKVVMKIVLSISVSSVSSLLYYLSYFGGIISSSGCYERMGRHIDYMVLSALVCVFEVVMGVIYGGNFFILNLRDLRKE